MSRVHTLLSLIIGSRGAFMESLGSDLNLRQLAFYGDKRDKHGSHTSFSQTGTTSIRSEEHTSELQSH